MNHYEAAKKKLDDLQKEAVETIEGPVMVLAGPGSGKTQILTLRIAEILNRTQVSPRNILALTFTETGVKNMRDRLTKFIGPDAYQVEIATFHSFASNLINTYGYAFEGFRLTKSIDELEQFRIIEDIIKSGDFPVFNRIRGDNYYVKHVLSAINQAKQEAISAQQILEFAQDFKTDASSETKRVALIKKRAVLLDLASAFEKYNSYLLKNRLYDYGDMLLRCIELISQQSEVKLYIQERFQYLLVDEYQDTNHAQNLLIELIADFFETPNLFVVGDDKQAIYRFQGASVENLSYFINKYPNLKFISLVNNYRSGSSIIDSAEKVISNNQLDISSLVGINRSKQVAVNPKGENSKLYVLKSREEELLSICNCIKNIKESGVEYSDIAVLCTTNNEVKEIVGVLAKQNIPTTFNSKINAINERIIQVLVSLFRAVNDPKDNLSVLSSLTVMLNNERLISLLELNKIARNEPLIKLAFNSDLKDAAQTILDLHKSSVTDDLIELSDKIIFETDFLTKLNSQKEPLHLLQLVSAFIAKLRKFAQNNPESKLSDFLQYYDAHAQHGVPFEVEISSTHDGVFVNTVHQAKGLEFNSVIIPSAQAWRVKRKTNIVNIPNELLFKTVTPTEDLEDLRRLFYVAITRAKKQLIFTVDSSQLTESQLVSELADTVSVKELEFKQQEIGNFIKSLLSMRSPINNKYLQQFIANSLKEFQFSFTSYWDYVTCPRTFLLKHILNFPQSYSPVLAYGNAVHKTLENFGKVYKSTGKIPTLQFLLELLQNNIMSEIPFNNSLFISKGSELMEKYYNDKLSKFSKSIEIEYNFKNHRVMLGEHCLTGKIDAIEKISKSEVRLIDYKTGNTSKTRNEILGATQNSDGKYFEQLKFYALLGKLDKQFPYSVKELEIRFIDDKFKFQHHKFDVSEIDLKEFQAKVKETLDQIIADKEFVQKDEDSELSNLFALLD